jgi:hypothetical protein
MKLIETIPYMDCCMVVTWQCFPWIVLPRNHIIYAIYHDMYISHDLPHVLTSFQARASKQSETNLGHDIEKYVRWETYTSLYLSLTARVAPFYAYCCIMQLHCFKIRWLSSLYVCNLQFAWQWYNICLGLYRISRFLLSQNFQTITISPDFHHIISTDIESFAAINKPGVLHKPNKQ